MTTLKIFLAGILFTHAVYFACFAIFYHVQPKPQQSRWKHFMAWWRDIEVKKRLYPAEVLVRMISKKIDELKKGEK